jgi:Cys-tRNA(Pro)/Cys-tRNA(Cys) deacylase
MTMAKKNKQQKLNSMRLLEANDIPYEAIDYDSSIKDAVQVAAAVGTPPFMVYKTLIVQSVATNKPLIVMIASENQLDLKKMATASGEKKVKMAKQIDAEKLTGLQAGGISALMLTDKHWPVYIDQPATELQYIVISAGQRGTQLRVPLMPLLNLLGAKIAEVSTESE